MKVRAGSRYRDRNGRVWGALAKDGDWSPYPYFALDPTGEDEDGWDAGGRSWLRPSLDLVEHIPA